MLCYSIAVHLSNLHNIMSGVATLKVCLISDHEPKDITEKDVLSSEGKKHQAAWLADVATVVDKTANPLSSIIRKVPSCKTHQVFLLDKLIER